LVLLKNDPVSILQALDLMKPNFEIEGIIFTRQKNQWQYQ